MLKNIRLVAAIIMLMLAGLLFVDVSGVLQSKLGWLARIQLVPAILAGSFITVAVLVIMTLLFGRIYCSIICPLGLFQDAVSRLAKPRRFRYRKNQIWLRVLALVIFVAAWFIGMPLVFGLLEPYSAFGRMATAFLGPVWQLGNNVLAWLAESRDAYWTGYVSIWVKGWAAFIAALATFIIIGVLAFVGGRLWCNSICPVGTVLGFISRFALLRPRIAAHDCVRCGKCAKVCKAACIDAQNAKIDASRCVACFNCQKACAKKAVTYVPVWPKPAEKPTPAEPDLSRRAVMTVAISAAAVLPLVKTARVWAAEAEEEIPALTRNQPYRREVPVLPPGAKDWHTFSKRCTACQLCVAACVNQVMASRDYGKGLLQPALSFERGYCRPNCVACTQICPTGAIKPLSVESKSALQIGRAVVDLETCLLPTGENCTTCSRNCPAAAIYIVTATEDGRNYPAVNHEVCTGCGACEYFCPVRPRAAIRVEGNYEQRRI